MSLSAQLHWKQTVYEAWNLKKKIVCFPNPGMAEYTIDVLLHENIHLSKKKVEK